MPLYEGRNLSASNHVHVNPILIILSSWFNYFHAFLHVRRETKLKALSTKLVHYLFILLNQTIIPYRVI